MVPNAFVDPLDLPWQQSHSTWTIANTAEAFPGTMTPLMWTFIDYPLEWGARKAFHSMGAYAKREVAVPDKIDERLDYQFFGKFSVNIDRIRDGMDRVPGMSGDDMERAYFGELRPGVTSKPQYRRYPFAFARMPYLIFGGPAIVSRVAKETAHWRRESLALLPSLSERDLRTLMIDAHQRFCKTMWANNIAGFVGGAVYGRGIGLVTQAGRPDMTVDFLSGYGSVDESKLVIDLWRTAMGQLDMDAFVARYGFHGPLEGDLIGTVWREDREPLQRILESYRGLPAHEQPEARESARRAAHRAAFEAVRTTLPRRKRWRVHVYEYFGKRFIPLRETTKATYLQTIDVARACARELAARLAATGKLNNEDDIYFLTFDEVTRGVSVPQDEIAFRRERHASYLERSLPEKWDGLPPLDFQSPQVESSNRVDGVGVSPGVVEGVARVVLDPRSDMVEPGEIVVCSVTDPSWVVLMMLAAGVVVDVGGPLSHTAIVARELGIPCVTATKYATTRIKTGDIVRMDGQTGTVEILKDAG